MTDEQKKARRISAESGNIRWIKDHCLRTKDGNDDYVFISYKSDDFEKVLDDIVYNTCRKYGLRVYFDTAFDDSSDSWIMQYYDNMCDPKCKAFIAFLDDAYYSSYACLLEMMSRKTHAAGGDYRWDSLFFLPVNIGSISDIVDNTNTGLGTKRDANGKINKHAAVERDRFNEIFSEVADEDESKRMRKVYKGEKYTKLYEEATEESPHPYGKMYLNVTQCRRLMEYVIPDKNDNNGDNKAFEEAIYDKLKNEKILSVFDGNWKAEGMQKEGTSVSATSNPGTKVEYWEGFCQYAKSIGFDQTMKMGKAADRSWHTIWLGNSHIRIECSFTANNIRIMFVVQDQPEVFAKAEQAQADIDAKLQKFGSITWNGRARAANVAVITSKDGLSVEKQYDWYCRAAETLNKTIRPHLGI